MGAKFGARHNVPIAVVICVVGTLAIGYFYYDGYLDAQAAMKDRMYTAASLSLGTYLFKSIALLFAMQLGIEAIGKRNERAGN